MNATVEDFTLAEVDMAPAIFIWEFMSFVCVDMEVTLELTAYVRVFCFLSWTNCLARILQASLLPLFAIFLISASWRMKEDYDTTSLGSDVLYVQ